MNNAEVKARRSQLALFGNPLSKKGRYNRRVVRTAIKKAYDKKIAEFESSNTEKARGKKP